VCLGLRLIRSLASDLQIAAKYGVETHAKLPSKVIMKRSLAEFSWKMVKPLFANRKLAINTSLIILMCVRLARPRLLDCEST
jgi:hypothetical protein